VYIARAFAARGADLALVARGADALNTLAAQLCSETGVRALAFAADLNETERYPDLLARVERELGPIDILVNNAGLESNRAFAEFAPERIEQMVRVDLLAPMLLTRALLPRLLQRGGGHIVNIASLAGKGATAYDVTYSSAKAGLVMFSQGLRAELHGSGVSVSVICPGFIADSGMYADKLALTGKPAPLAVGVSPPKVVADSVIDAIVRDRCETIVNPVPMRFVFALSQLFPSLMGFLSRKTGVTAVFKAAAAAEQQAERQQLAAGSQRAEN
jgi:short-subunit dehydrogenase